MDISESYTLHAPREQVWDTLLAPDTLKRSVPGCESLEQTGDDSYAVRLNVTIDEIRGVYDGTLHLLDVRKPEMYRVVVDSAGAQGDLHSDAALRLEAKDADTTVIHWSGQARLGGAIASVDGETAGGAASKLVRQYFDQLAELLPDTTAPLAPAETARAPRQRATTSHKPKDQVAAPKSERTEQQDTQDETTATTATSARSSGGATPRRRSGNSGNTRQRASKAKAAETAAVAEAPETESAPGGQDIQPSETAAPLDVVGSENMEATPTEAPVGAQTQAVLDITPPTQLDTRSPTAERAMAEPVIIPANSEEEPPNATAASATITTLRRFAQVTFIDRSALDSGGAGRWLKAADVLGVLIAIAAVALTALIVWLVVGSLH